MKTALLKYNKVTNESFLKLKSIDDNLQLIDLGNNIDSIKYSEIDNNLKHLNLDCVVVGDIFWPTGQNICKWCINNKVKCYFLQHGQWIYTKNKKNPEYLPYCIFVYGNDIKTEIKNWEYWNNTFVISVGSPRYDDLFITTEDYIYFSPPVLVEQNPSAPNIVHKKSYSWIKQLQGIDQFCNLLIQPHYREKDVDFLKKNFPLARICPKENSALPYITASKKIITHRNSTVVLDGIASKKQVCLINFTDYDNSYFKMNYFGEFALESSNKEELIKNILSPNTEIYDYNNKCQNYIKLEKSSQLILGIIKNGVSTDNYLRWV